MRILSIRRSFVLLFAGLFTTLSVATYSQAPIEPDDIISRLWLERADEILSRDNLMASDLQAAASAIAAAKEFVPSGRDTLFLEALLLLKGYPSDSPVRGAWALLGKSLDDVRPSDRETDLVDFERRARLWAAQALRLREYRELLKRYRSWPAGNRDDPALIYAAGRAALYLGLESEAATLAKQGESLADDPRALESLGSVFRISAQPAFRALAVAAGDPVATGTLDAAWRRWGDGLTGAITPWLLTGQIHLGDSPVYAKALPPDLYRALTELESGRTAARTIGELPAGLKTDLAYLRRVKYSESGGLLSGFTGTLTADADYDGYDEEIIRMVNGRPDFRRVDSNQDGLYEWEILYEDSNPTYVRFDDGQLTFAYEPGAYPSVISAVRENKNLHVDVFFQPGGFLWAVSVPGDYLTLLEYPEWDDEDFWQGARMVNVSYKDPTDGSVTEARTYLADGYPLRALERRFSAGAPDSPEWLRELIYKDGIPVAGRRSYRADPEFSGRRIWELYERYENGGLIGIAWDPGMTGTPAYLRDWALNRYLETQVWDLDADRWVDVRRFVLPGGETAAAKLFVTQARVQDLLAWTSSDWAPWEY